MNLRYLVENTLGTKLPNRCNRLVIEMIEVLDLAERPDVVGLLASWNYQYWEKKTPEVSFEDWRQFYLRCLESAPPQIPRTLIGFVDGHLFGAVTIVEVDDIKEFVDYRPWIAALIVHEDFRGQRLGLNLMAAALQEVKAMGLLEVFLWTDSQDKWYAEQGWNEIHRMPFGPVEAVVMRMPI
jgi:GNAT superfamily N-acetyltransferase